ncbi:hypothetical protein PRIPAC_87329 [Pristionchus pacificus]|uniref:Uncharacterized protein n=1 Tax=Pristionchus pacificus TaxID=54126 RepID=A0A2A6CWG2_PRIPA|nr:hypothetical protein PRIPAC_87329 [Pristionchus pacificus]|eukprot:PDM82373.1 hypothetical protein PRIPAC_36766 [Pristionchus pacificus]
MGTHRCSTGVGMEYLLPVPRLRTDVCRETDLDYNRGEREREEKRIVRAFKESRGDAEDIRWHRDINLLFFVWLLSSCQSVGQLLEAARDTSAAEE